eukprot:CAMPEP_0171759958 /NCGR_PEP_ID=MMETSP0991-20121206/47185_1 /TAXON_ID=483369 /ORGANISM="non described non described, Strain CCMP2098" /LENGTH=94 /DNA_ID=CAMNT_0012362959 /DNA_START=101 /DNA_END=382 /DNA_ORIENTATION=-
MRRKAQCDIRSAMQLSVNLCLFRSAPAVQPAAATANKAVVVAVLLEAVALPEEAAEDDDDDGRGPPFSIFTPNLPAPLPSPALLAEPVQSTLAA